jgi:hypothetical protein
MLVAGVAVVAIPGARQLERSSKQTFEGSTVRFDKPGTYVGGDVGATRAGGGGRIGGGGDATESWTVPEVEDAVLPDGDFVPVAYSCDPEKADSTDVILAAGFKSWCQEGGCADPDHPDPADWGHYWCEVAVPAADRCSANPERSRTEMASRNYNLARRALLRQLGCLGGAGETDFPTDPARGWGWQNIACYWTSPEYLRALYGCLPPGWKPPTFPPIPGGPPGPPPACRLPLFDPNQSYCRPI